jgi:crotonobetainyl-CoA:carnitine CoA-transferase CaiB-like acyl-CoA transferase
LNLKHERGRELLFRMVERADVLLENFSPGTMDGLGVGWSRLHEINARLIYATGTGFGVSGPDRDNLAMDMTIQAASEIMSRSAPNCGNARRISSGGCSRTGQSACPVPPRFSPRPVRAFRSR